MSSRSAAAAAVCALALSACAGGGAPSPQAAASKAAIRRTIVTFMRELAVANGRVACGGLTASGQSSVIGVLGPELANFGIDTCEGTVQVTGRQLTRALRLELLKVAVASVSLRGARASVPWSQVSIPGGRLQAIFGRRRAIQLREIRGFWFISRF